MLTESGLRVSRYPLHDRPAPGSILPAVGLGRCQVCEGNVRKSEWLCYLPGDRETLHGSPAHWKH